MEFTEEELIVTVKALLRDGQKEIAKKILESCECPTCHEPTFEGQCIHCGREL